VRFFGDCVPPFGCSCTVGRLVTRGRAEGRRGGFVAGFRLDHGFGSARLSDSANLESGIYLQCGMGCRRFGFGADTAHHGLSRLLVNRAANQETVPGFSLGNSQDFFLHSH
jgi:hypothetical protein